MGNRVGVDVGPELHRPLGVAKVTVHGYFVNGDVGRTKGGPQPVAVDGKLFGKLARRAQVVEGRAAVTPARGENGGQES